MIHCYWEASAPPPAYLVLTVTTWREHIDLGDLVVINHSNIAEFVGGYYDVSALKRFSLAKQSDAVSAAVLDRFGGLFLDVDTLLVNDNCRSLINRRLSDPNGDSFTLFGQPEAGSMHIAVISATKGSSVAHHWAIEASKVIPGSDGSGPWNHLGNAILEPYYRSLGAKNDAFAIWDLHDAGVIAEKYEPLSEGESSQSRYEDYWFTDLSDAEAELRLAQIAAAPAGLVMLHNSWTPQSFAALTASEVLESRTLLGRLLAKLAHPELCDYVERLLVYGTRRGN